jgi:hypothetical protein
MKQRMKRSGEKPMRYCLRDPRRTMGNNETIIKEYQNQSAVSNQAGRDPSFPRGDMMAIPAKTNCAEEGKKIAQMHRAHLFHGVSEISLCD